MTQTGARSCIKLAGVQAQGLQNFSTMMYQRMVKLILFTSVLFGLAQGTCSLTSLKVSSADLFVREADEGVGLYVEQLSSTGNETSVLASILSNFGGLDIKLTPGFSLIVMDEGLKLQMSGTGGLKGARTHLSVNGPSVMFVLALAGSGEPMISVDGLVDILISEKHIFFDERDAQGDRITNLIQKVNKGAHVFVGHFTKHQTEYLRPPKTVRTRTPIPVGSPQGGARREAQKSVTQPKLNPKSSGQRPEQPAKSLGKQNVHAMPESKPKASPHPSLHTCSNKPPSGNTPNPEEILPPPSSPGHNVSSALNTPPVIPPQPKQQHKHYSFEHILN